MTATRQPTPALFDHADVEVVWAIVALFREDGTRSYRSIARTAGCSHPHVSRVLREWREAPEAVDYHLAQSGYLL